MNHVPSWEWTTLVILGAWHGVNPGMGWLLAAALGLQQKSEHAIWRSLLPIATGHFLATGLIVLAGVLAGSVIPLHHAKAVVAILLFGFGVYRLIVRTHPKLSARRVNFRELAFWSFLMASVHGAGIMLLPILLGMSAASQHHNMHHHAMAFSSLQQGSIAVTIHSMAYLLVMGTTAWIFYKHIGAILLRKVGPSLDLIWAYALILTAAITLLIPL